MYEAFYGFKQRPFSLNPDPDFLYLSKKHRTALSLLEYSLLNQAAFSVITGEIGTGKTTLIRYLLHHMEGNFSVGLITNTHANFGELLQWALMAFGLEYREKGKVELYHLLYDYLIHEYAQNRQILLIIDEAQNLGSEALEELRMLSNINTDDNQLLQMILVGQPGLRSLLKQPGLEQFAQRIAVDYHLESLDQKEVYEYIYHRIEVAGGEPLEIFDWDACGAIYLYSQGVPRLINLLLDTALVYGFAEQKKQIGAKLIRQVVQDKQQGGLFPLRAQDVNIQEAKTNGQLDNEVPWPPEPKILTAIDDFGESSREKAVIEAALEQIGDSITKDEWPVSWEEGGKELHSAGLFQRSGAISGQAINSEEPIMDRPHNSQEEYSTPFGSAFLRKISKGFLPKMVLVVITALLSIGIIGIFFPQKISTLRDIKEEKTTSPNADLALAEVKGRLIADEAKRATNSIPVELAAQPATEKGSIKVASNTGAAPISPRPVPELSLEREDRSKAYIATISGQKMDEASAGKNSAAESDEFHNKLKTMILSESLSNGANEIKSSEVAKEKQVRQVTIQKGDSLAKIIIDTYGEFNEDLLRRILQLNPHISDRNLLFIGQTIELPAS